MDKRVIIAVMIVNHMGIGTETAAIGDIPAGTTKNISIDVPCPTGATYSMKSHQCTTSSPQLQIK